jgi:hypothetical protein
MTPRYCSGMSFQTVQDGATVRIYCPAGHEIVSGAAHCEAMLREVAESMGCQDRACQGKRRGRVS